jgi:hypothetical protein
VTLNGSALRCSLSISTQVLEKSLRSASSTIDGVFREKIFDKGYLLYAQANVMQAF